MATEKRNEWSGKIYFKNVTEVVMSPLSFLSLGT